MNPGHLQNVAVLENLNEECMGLLGVHLSHPPSAHNEPTFESFNADVLDLLPASLPASPFGDIQYTSEDGLSDISLGRDANIADILQANNVPLPVPMPFNTDDAFADSLEIVTDQQIDEANAEDRFSFGENKQENANEIFATFSQNTWTSLASSEPRTEIVIPPSTSSFDDETFFTGSNSEQIWSSEGDGRLCQSFTISSVTSSIVTYDSNSELDIKPAMDKSHCNSDNRTVPSSDHLPSDLQAGLCDDFATGIPSRQIQIKSETLTSAAKLAQASTHDSEPVPQGVTLPTGGCSVNDQSAEQQQTLAAGGAVTHAGPSLSVDRIQLTRSNLTVAAILSSTRQLQGNPGLRQLSSAYTVSEILGTNKKKKKPKQDKNLPCAVCGDDAQCLHYGVPACEGCKGFFKRTVQKNSRYMCLGKERCKIDKRRRNHCQYCRYQKCLEVGMMKEVVRKDGLKGRRGRLPSAVARQTRSRAKSPPSPVSMITALVRAFLDTCPTKSSLDYSQFRVPIEPEAEFDLYEMSMMAMKPNDPHDRLQQFYDNLCASFHHIKNWAGKIPGWNNLPEEDRFLLFQTASLEILVLRIAYRYHPSEQHVVFCNGKVLHRCQAVFGFGEWLDYIIAFCEVIHRMDIDISSFACLTALTLVTERNGLKEPKKVERLQEELIEALQDHIANCPAVEGRTNYMSKLLSLIPELRTLSKQGLHRLYYLKLEGGIPAPPMLSRMFQPNLPY
ncbi:nuclear receptor subfamily 4 group A member 2-like isoform X2 [Ptychodera flava]|uniref:nuclear receptor subfamily 4 group A member 2-like isoform X2 n=2 Tax=Ptychodera flava TaxID=63121 RepID=UPI00396A11E9